MREVNNNPEFNKVPKRHNVPFGKDEKPSSPQDNVADESVKKSFDNPHAELLGRSQVGNIDALNKDIAFGLKYPEKIDRANKVFDTAYQQTGDYAKASEIMDAYVKEFC